jgi:hypothetical protein
VAAYAEVAAMLAQPPPAWKEMYLRYNLVRPIPEQVVETILDFTPSGREYGPRGPGRHVPPPDVRAAALKGLRLSHKNNYTSASGIGIARAVQLALAPEVWDRTVKRMDNYFLRHRKDQEARNFGNDRNPSRGYMAWLNWGGDPGWEWAHLRK